MPEPLTTVGFGAIAAYLGKDGLSKILGPTADYLGGELKELTQRRVEAVGNIFSNAEGKLGNKLDQNGKVPPKVLKNIINEGSYAEDRIALEYFGGVLASSRTELGRDDRGARLAKIIDGMTVYQLRAHYIIYSAVSHVFSQTENSFGQSVNRAKMQIFIPFTSLISSLGLNEVELNNPQLLSHIFHGLDKDDLIESSWQFGDAESMKSFYKDANVGGVACQPSAHGAEIFLWAFGHGDKPMEFILTNEFQSEIEGLQISLDGVLATKT